MQVYSDELYHYGIKGMKWGVRKTKHQSIKDARAKQNIGKHSKSATIERRIKDTSKTVKKTTKGVFNIVKENVTKVARPALELYFISKITGLDKKISEIGSNTVNNGSNYVSDMMKDYKNYRIKRKLQYAHDLL